MVAILCKQSETISYIIQTDNYKSSKYCNTLGAQKYWVGKKVCLSFYYRKTQTNVLTNLMFTNDVLMSGYH